MGSFSHNCKLTGVPITSGQPAVLIVMKPQENIYDNSEENLKKYGSTYMCSNDGTKLKYLPVWFPIKGEYDDYGGLENIKEDDNTKAIEEYYGLPIQDLINIITSSRKDDGYDGSLDVIKKPKEYPSDWIEGEKHLDYYGRKQNDPQPFEGNYPDSPGNKFRVYRNGKMVNTTKEEYDADFKLIHDHYKRYNEWKENNPDPEDDYRNPQYQERYKELLCLSGMWVHGKVYEELTKEKVTDQWKDSLDLGTPQLLKSLGFEQGKKTKRERYNIPFTKDGLTIYSDGNWLDIKNEHIYRLKDLKKYCEKKGVTIDITEHQSKDLVEQIYDYVIPTFKVPKIPIKPTQEQIDELKKSIEEMKVKQPDLAGLFNFDNDDEYAGLLMARDSLADRDDNSHLTLRVNLFFLNTERFGSGKVTNPMTSVYIQKAKEGKLKNDVVEFARFDHYMYCCGCYYEIVGTGPQDGEEKQVMKVLNVATKVLQDIIDERYSDNDEDEDEE